MSDSVTDRIAAITRRHREELHEEDVCICGYHGNWATHVAGAIVEQLGLIPQWAAAADDPDRPGDWSEFVHTGDYRADAQEDADCLDGGYVVIRYVTKWEAE